VLLRGVNVVVNGSFVVVMDFVGHQGYLCGVMDFPSFWCISC